jgi:hypothetical protein
MILQVSQGGLSDFSVMVITAGVEGIIGGMGMMIWWAQAGLQIKVGTGSSYRSLGSHDQHFQGGLFEQWCSVPTEWGAEDLWLHTDGDCFLPGEVVLDITDSNLFLPETVQVFFRYLPGSGVVQRK